jgi:alginate O-acetyltransferase complex protein AlgI
MLFNSYPFVFGFLPVLLAAFAVVSAYDWRRAGAALLIVGSFFFYAWWNWHYLFLFGFSIAFNYLWSLMLKPLAAGTSDASSAGSRRRWLLGVGVAVNIALLGYFKYRNFLVEGGSELLGRQVHLAPLVLPLAVSFFTFEQITYLVGAYQGEEGHGDFVSYLLFITFFPHLIAGPIVRYYEIYPQFNRSTRLRLTAENLSEGLMIFAIGLFKKVMLADTFRTFVGPIFDRMEMISFFDAWGATLAFALEIYFDFSGYSDMAIGLARMFGVKFPENFDSPYKARNVIEFWRHWHITLSFFLRDYLYIPLGGNRRGELRRHLNLFITMVLGGLWHGANWTFLLWGAVHGAMLSINHLWANTKRQLPDVVAWALTFVLVTAAWVLFRAQTFTRASLLLTSMIGLHGFAWHAVRNSIGPRELRELFIGLVIVLFCPNRQTIMGWRWESDWLYAGAFAVLAAVSIMSMSNPPPFIYFQF